MYKISFFTVGKTKESYLAEALEEYKKRLQGKVSFHWHLVKEISLLRPLLSKEDSYFCLDPKGTLYTSMQFSKFLLKELETQNSRLNFVIGDADGIPEDIKVKSRGLISLSPLTFTHQITRIIIVEQIYRALEIDRGSKYHK